MDFSRVQNAGSRVFGETVDYTPLGGNVEPVRGIFDAEHQVAEIFDVRSDGGPMEVSSRRPVLSVNLKALDDITPKRGDLVRAQTVLYQVVDIMPDGQGDADLLLAIVKEA